MRTKHSHMQCNRKINGPNIVAYQLCAYADSEFILNANYERHAQHHVLPNCDRERAPSSCEPTPRSPPAGGSLVGS